MQINGGQAARQTGRCNNEGLLIRIESGGTHSVGKRCLNVKVIESLFDRWW